MNFTRRNWRVETKREKEEYLDVALGIKMIIDYHYYITIINRMIVRQ